MKENEKGAGNPVPNMIIGIDPDLTASGLAMGLNGKVVAVGCYSFHELRDFLGNNRQYIKKVYLEASWLIKKTSWHGSANKATAEKTAYHVGSNHAVGKLIEECLQALGITYVLIKPFATKKKKEEFCRMTGWKGAATNQEERDAAMLIHGHY